MADDKPHGDVAAAASLVASLMTTADSAESLGDFRGEHLSSGSELTLAQLRAARGLLLALAQTLGSDNEARWLALMEAAEQLGVVDPAADDGSLTEHDDEDDRPTEKPPDSVQPPTLARPPTEPATVPPPTVRRDAAAAKASATAPGSEPDAVWPFAAPAQQSMAELALAAETMAKREVTLEGRSMSAPVYAVLCATCGAFPERVRETHAKFGIANHEARDALDGAWQRVFDEEPRLRELWDALFKQFRAWLIQYGSV